MGVPTAQVYQKTTSHCRVHGLQKGLQALHAGMHMLLLLHMSVCVPTHACAMRVAGLQIVVCI